MIRGKPGSSCAFWRGFPHLPALLQVRPDNLNQLIGCQRLGRAGFARGIEDMKADVVLQELGHESIHGAAGGGDELQYVCTVLVTFERPLDSFNLSADATDTQGELFFFAKYVGHIFDDKMRFLLTIL